MKCRIGCGACCIAPSISSPMPGMLAGKPANVRCVHLTLENQCELFGLPERPAVCVQFAAMRGVCGHSKREAIENIQRLELLTV